MRRLLLAPLLALALSCSGGGSDAAPAPTSSGPDLAAVPRNIEPTGATEVVETAVISSAPLCSWADDGCPLDADPAIGTPAPLFATRGPDGTDVAGPGTDRLVVFVAHWCDFCDADLDVLATAADELDILLVSTGQNPEAARWPPSAWLADAGWTGPVAVDDLTASIAQAYGVRGLPFVVAVGPTGEVVARDSGAQTLDSLRALAGASGRG